MSRQEYNQKILDLIGDDIKTKFASIIYEYLKNLIEEYPDQRFGQLVCNYVCPDYRSGNISNDTLEFLDAFFDIRFDPFFEESSETYERLTNGK